MSDPRWRRAELIREHVICELEARRDPATVAMMHISLRDCVPPGVSAAEIQRALQVLRRQGVVRYRRRHWERVP